MVVDGECGIIFTSIHIISILIKISQIRIHCIEHSIMGGIATVLEWWPIKAYRPCPNFVERGGKYVRSGQGKCFILCLMLLLSETFGNIYLPVLLFVSIHDEKRIG